MPYHPRRRFGNKLPNALHKGYERFVHILLVPFLRGLLDLSEDGAVAIASAIHLVIHETLGPSLVAPVELPGWFAVY